VGEFGGYIRANDTWIPNYGERYRERVGAGDGLRTRYLNLGKVALF
jgi:hypothetical protein